MIRLLKVSDRMKHIFLVLSIIFFVTDAIGQATSSSRSNEEVPDATLGSRVQTTTTKNGRLLSLCNEPRIDFESYITMDYSIVCAALAQSDNTLLETGITTAYNDLFQPQYCDPLARLISSVTYINETSYSDGTKVKVTFLVKGTFQGSDSMLPVDLFGTNYTIADGCSCPANQSVNQTEFLSIYESTVLNDDAQDLVCVTTLAGDVAPTRLPSQAPTNVEFNCPVDLSTPLTSQFLVTLNDNATQSTLEELGQDLMDTYNALMNETYSTCQTNKYRQITNIVVSPTTCATTVPIGAGRIRGRQLQGLALSQETIVFDVEGGCGDGCDPNELFFDPEVLTEVDFTAYYSSTVDTGLEFLSEIEILDCPSTSDLKTAVIVEYVPQDSGVVDSTDLSSNGLLMQQLEFLFVKTYNDLSRSYCDPYGRQLVSANIALVGAINSFGNIPVEMGLVGTCSNCDGVDLSIYDVPTSDSTTNETDFIFFEGLFGRRSLLEGATSKGRVLQGCGSTGDSICYCPAHPVGDRGVYETEFLDAYRRVINESSLVVEAKDSLTGNQGLGVEVAECQFGDEFRTSFLFDLQAPALTEEERVELLDSLRHAIAEPFLITDEVCNPQFRTIDVAEIGPDRSVNGRRAQQVTSPPSATPSLSPAPSSSPRPSVSRVPTASPTPPLPTLLSSTVPLYIYVTGICNGCKNQITFDDQTNGRRLQGHELEDKMRTGNNDWFRQLESDQPNATSNCFCPIGSEIVASPSLQDILDLFVANLRSVGIPYNISNFREAPVVDCTVPETQFSSQFHYAVALEPNVTVAQVQAVGDIIRSTYNDLIDDFCDPQDHTIDSIELVQFVHTSGEIVPKGCLEYDITFDLTGRCRGCSGADSLFSPTPAATVVPRLLHQDWFLYPYQLQNFSHDTSGCANHKSTSKRTVSNIPPRRRLQASLGDDCFCDGAVIDTRPPYIEEFNMALVTALSDFQVTNVCGIPNFIPTSQPTSAPSRQPSLVPTDVPTESPTWAPTPAPTVTMAPTRGHGHHGKGPTIAPATPAPTVTAFPTMPAFPVSSGGP